MRSNTELKGDFGKADFSHVIYTCIYFINSLRHCEIGFILLLLELQVYILLENYFISP